MNLNSHNFENIYKDLGIDLNSLGCIMLDLDGSQIKHPDIPESWLYHTKDPKKFWIKGLVSAKTPHITLLYGLLKPGLEWKAYVDQVLKDWKLPTVTINHISYFDSPYGEDEPYYCIVAHVKITPQLLEGHERLSFLPHVNTFPGYKAHLTLAYVHKDNFVKKDVIASYEKLLLGKELKVIGINYGGNK